MARDDTSRRTPWPLDRSRPDDAHDERTDVLHLDMDSFFAAVEVLDDPSLAGRPVVVGGIGPRGVVASASYEARKFGIRSAMPTAQARQLCPQAEFRSGRFERYHETSQHLHELMERVTPHIEPIALDEAFLDVSGSHRVHGSSEEIAQHLRADVARELSLPCSVGVGRSKLIVKLASKGAKPKISDAGVELGPGVLLIRSSDELAFLHAHAIRALPGIGPRTAERLRRLGISTVGDLAELERELLVRHFGRVHGASLFDLARAHDPRTVVTGRATRSVGHEETFDLDDFDRSSLNSCARRLAVRVASRCRSAELCWKTVTVKVRYGDFTTITRSRSAALATTSRVLGDVACGLLETIETERGIRLLGVSVSGLEPIAALGAVQLELFANGLNASGFDEGEQRYERLESAADEIRQRFGRDAISSVAANPRRR